MRRDQLFWDGHWLSIAKQTSVVSRDSSTKVGAVLIRPDNTLCSMGYNGFPRGMPDDDYLYEDRTQKMSRIIHAEMNAVLFNKDQSLEGYTVYTYPFLSCERCFVHLVNAGIRRFVAPKCPEHLKERWEPSFQNVRKWAKEFNFDVKIDEVDFY